MPQFNLPANSIVKPGKFYPTIANSSTIKRVIVYRYDPDFDGNPRTDTYEVDLDTLWSNGSGCIN